jgi:hypothetical protein
VGPRGLIPVILALILAEPDGSKSEGKYSRYSYSTPPLPWTLKVKNGLAAPQGLCLKGTRTPDPTSRGGFVVGEGGRNFS